jgi:phosphoglycolate phosphatase-like HAD superfamily hydrolase
MTSPTAKTVIFDLDGTLIDSMGIFTEVVISNLEKCGVVKTKESMDEIGIQLLETHQVAQSNSGVILIFQIFWGVGRTFGLSRIRSLQFTIRCIKIVKEVYKNAPLFPNTKQSLEKLAENGYCLGVCTSANREQMILTLEKHGIIDLFNPEALISRDDVTTLKPAPEGLFLAIGACSARVEDCFFLGDMPVDMIAGDSAGLITIGLTTGLVSRELLLRFSSPTVVLDSIEEATKWILNSNK